MANMMSKLIDGRVVVAVHGKEDPTDLEWRHFTGLWHKAHDPTDVVVLVLTKGGSPNASQRDALNQLGDGANAPTAVITQSLMPRMAIRAMSWINRMKIQPLSPDELDSAREHLDLDADSWDNAKEAARALQAEMGIKIID